MFRVATHALFSLAAGLIPALFCAPARAQVLSAFSSAAEGTPPPPWRVVGLPGSKKPVTRFDVVQQGNQKVLRIRADKSYGNLSYTFPAPAKAGMLHWRWRLDQPVADADLRHKNGDDTPVKVCALFDMPLDNIGFVERNLLRLARRASGEYLPSATLCYVWDQKLTVGTELPNAFTHRMRYLVLDSGGSPLQQWITHARDLRIDFLHAFGEETDTVPPLLAIVVGADADNTGGSSLAYVGDLTLMEQYGP